MKLIPITERTACVDGTTMTIVYRLPDGGCVLLDPGHPADGEALDALLRREGLPVRGMLSTHNHHDHFGNARFFAKKYGLPIILPIGEAAGCRSAAAYAHELGFFSTHRVAQSKALSSVLGPVDETIGFAQDSVAVAGVRFGVLHTPGHSTDCVSFRTPDGVLVVGDVLVSHDVLSMLRAPYSTSIGEDLDSKRLIARTPCVYCVAAHRDIIPGGDVPALAEENLRVIRDMLDAVLAIVRRPMSIDEIIPLFCEARGIRGATPPHGMQVRHTVSALVGRLLDEGALAPETARGLTRYAPAQMEPPQNEAPFGLDGSESQGHHRQAEKLPEERK